MKYDLDVSCIKYKDEILHLPINKNKWDEMLTKYGIDEKISNELDRYYDFNRGEIKLYKDYIFNQDINRAALSIALHNLSPYDYPKIFSIRFSIYPLTFLLIVIDEIQEYFRPHNIELAEIERLKGFPNVTVQNFLYNNNFRMRIIININFLKQEGYKEEKIIKDFNEKQKAKGGECVSNYDQLIQKVWNEVFKTINTKLSFEIDEPLELYVRIKLENKDPAGNELYFQSPNWTESVV